MIALARAPELVATTVRAPLVAAASLLAHEESSLWMPRDDGWVFATAGVAVEISGAGAMRYAEIASAARELFARLRVIGDGPAPRMFGGFAFAPGAGWDGFPDARFVLPRYTYWRRGDEAWLTRIDSPPLALTDRAPAPLPKVIAIHEADPEIWRHHIAEIRAAIGDGVCTKIVAARTCTVEMAGPIDPATVLARLPGETTRFAIRRGGRVFVGATPERLVRLSGREVATEALAGSIARNSDDATQVAKLIASDKDQGEHRWVVDAIRAALEPLCARLEIPPAPAVRTLRNIHHLHTPVRGTLASPRHVVEIAGALHPTPAVGGTPREAALAWIASREPERRGWYGAPVGWFDAAGDGELAIAIRSGLLEGPSARLYAGAGIVRDSDAELELDETRVKLRAFLGALGVPPTGAGSP